MSYVASRFVLRKESLWGTFTAVREVVDSEEDVSVVNGRSAYLVQNIISDCYRSIKAFFAVITQCRAQQL